MADGEQVDYRYLLSAGDLFPGVPLCDPNDPTAPPCPNIATAANGDWIVLEGEGTLSIHPKTAGGGGIFTHYFADGGSVSGTWEATELLSFSSYGPSPLPGWPAEFLSGRARMKVDLLVGGAKVADAILTVGCLLPDVDAPGGVFEGGTLNVQGGSNFSKLGGGGMFSTLFIQL
jgi:hypothetical protein